MSFILRSFLLIILLFSFNSKVTCLLNCQVLLNYERFSSSGHLHLTLVLPSQPYQINIDIELSLDSDRSDQSELPSIRILGSESDTLLRMIQGSNIKYVLLNTNYNEVKSVYLNGLKYCQSVDNFDQFASNTRRIQLEYNLSRTNYPLGLSVIQNRKYIATNSGVSPPQFVLFLPHPNTDSRNYDPYPMHTHNMFRNSWPEGGLSDPQNRNYFGETYTTESSYKGHPNTDSSNNKLNYFSETYSESSNEGHPSTDSRNYETGSIHTHNVYRGLSPEGELFNPQNWFHFGETYTTESSNIGHPYPDSSNNKPKVQKWGAPPQSGSVLPSTFPTYPEEDILSPSPNTDSGNHNPNQRETRFNFDDECGKRELVATHATIDGTDIRPNEFPWLVALFNDTRKYFCAGTLVSDRHVISAAHCTIKKDMVNMELGKHKLDDIYESGVYFVKSKKIINHPDFVADTGHADISIIITKKAIPFSNKIRPICIWTRESRDADEIGTVVGWGVDRSGSNAKVPMSVEIHSVSNADCLNSSDIYQNITSDTTFCAGGRGKGPCFGDSGSGFIVQKINRWYLQGIVSISIKKSSISCDVTKFSVYCNVGKYLNWIKQSLIKYV